MHPFTAALLEWYQENPRNLPWKDTRDPYTIWISEIILQQTRVAQGTPYFHRFINRFPTIKSLASASEDAVLKQWEGLGYYSRARNLHSAAKTIVEQHEGKFPQTYQEIIALKGVGPYTAAAIASFAYDLPHAVLDGNVIRVLSRYFGIESPVDDAQTKKQIWALAQEVLPEDQAADHNQAIMNFGALVCTPAKPICLFCPLHESCFAYQHNLVNSIPIKSKKTKKIAVSIHFAFYRSNGKFIVQRRTENIWKGLYELPQIIDSQLDYIRGKALDITGPVTHVLTHRKMQLYFYELPHFPEEWRKEWVAVEEESWDKLAYPKPILQYLTEKLERE